MKQLTLPKAMFFDWDGTLVDSFSFIHSAHQHTRKALGMDDFLQEDFKSHFGKQRDEILDGIYGDRRNEGQACFESFVRDNHIKRLNPMPGAKLLLDYIGATNIISGIVSNKKSCLIKKEVSHFGWDGYFTSIIGAGDAGRDKPFADPLLLALTNSGVEPHSEHVWYVGDTQIDVDCARGAGCGAVFLCSGHETLEDSYPLLIVENCLQLHEFLLQCTQN